MAGDRRIRVAQSDERARPGSPFALLSGPPQAQVFVLYAAPTEQSLVTGSAVVSGTGLLRLGDRHSRTIAGTHGADIEGVVRRMQPSDRRPQREKGEELAKAGRPQLPLIRTSASKGPRPRSSQTVVMAMNADPDEMRYEGVRLRVR